MIHLVTITICLIICLSIISNRWITLIYLIIYQGVCLTCLSTNRWIAMIMYLFVTELCVSVFVLSFLSLCVCYFLVFIFQNTIVSFIVKIDCWKIKRLSPCPRVTGFLALHCYSACAATPHYLRFLGFTLLQCRPRQNLTASWFLVLHYYSACPVKPRWFRIPGLTLLQCMSSQTSLLQDS